MLGDLVESERTGSCSTELEYNARVGDRKVYAIMIGPYIQNSDILYRDPMAGHHQKPPSKTI